MDDGKEKHSGDKKQGPPIKVLSSQLREGKCKVSHGKTECIIKRVGQAEDIPVSTVWMQGTVLKVHLDSLVILDETGTFVVNGAGDIPQGEPFLCEGRYVMVMGVIQALSPEPALRAVKMANLSGHAQMHRRMWRFEVEDLQNTLRTT